MYQTHGTFVMRSKGNMFKHLILAIAAFAALVFAQSSIAAELKIGFVDQERITRESAPADRASKQLEKEFAPRAQEMQRREAQIKTLQGQLEKDAITMSEGDRRAKEQELGRLTLDFQRMQREYREDLNLRRNQELGALFERANRVIRQIAEAEKYDLILQEAVYRNPRIDITDRVLKALSDSK
jgi:outer membrane protein